MKTQNSKPTQKQDQYVVTSKPGMTPFATRTSRRAAEKDAKLARRLGLDGKIALYRDGVEVAS